MTLGSPGLMFRCFTDIRVNEYIVGEGPTTLTAVIVSGLYAMGTQEVSTPEQVARGERVRIGAERALVWGGAHGDGILEVTSGGISGREKVMFIGLEFDYAIEAFKITEAWDVVRSGDGTVLVHHPWRSYWLSEAESNRSKVEWTLADLKTGVVAAYNARNTKYDGRIASGTQYPRVISNAAKSAPGLCRYRRRERPRGPTRASASARVRQGRARPWPQSGSRVGLQDVARTQGRPGR